MISLDWSSVVFKLIIVVEKLKKKANVWAADLRIVEIPDNVDYEIEE